MLYSPRLDRGMAGGGDDWLCLVKKNRGAAALLTGALWPGLIQNWGQRKLDPIDACHARTPITVLTMFWRRLFPIGQSRLRWPTRHPLKNSLKVAQPKLGCN